MLMPMFFHCTTQRGVVHFSINRKAASGRVSSLDGYAVTWRHLTQRRGPRRQSECMSTNEIGVFFYGLFMDESLLASKGVRPTELTVSYVDGYGLPSENVQRYFLRRIVAHMVC
jgi:hypothetical protein